MKKSKIEDKDNIYDDNNYEIYFEGEGKSNLSGSGKNINPIKLMMMKILKKVLFLKEALKKKDLKIIKLKKVI